MTDEANAADADGQDRGETLRRRILEQALPNIAFDGWSRQALAEAAEAAGYARALADAAFPRGGVDAAIFHHREGDRELSERLAATDLSDMRIRERVIYAVRLRLEIAARRREAVRRAAALFALPTNAPEGGRLMWETADAIWTGLGDPSEDFNWYSKRAILSSVYASTALYWLGDESRHFEDTWAFLARRVEGVMRFEKAKAAVNKHPLGRLALIGPNYLAAQIRAPKARRGSTEAPVDLPG